MTRKPQSEWTEAYRKRIERAIAQGKSKQEARGHKQAEHVTRAVNKGLPPPKPRLAGSGGTRRPAAPPPPPPETEKERYRRLKREAQHERDRKLREAGRATKSDRAFARAYGRSIAQYIEGVDPDDVAQQAVDSMDAIGVRRFRAEAGKQREMRHRYLYGPYDPKNGITDLSVLRFWANNHGFPEERWYFYH